MIRQFSQDDAKTCCELICACIRHDPEIPAGLRQALLQAETSRSMEERSRLFYIAVWETDGEVAGLGGLDMNEIRLLYVSPAHQRRGIGRALLEHLEAQVPPALFKDVFVYAAISSSSFYQTCGYSPQGQHGFEIGGQFLQTIFMTKLLRPDADGQTTTDERR
jgi:N-acetylglutamate synthase-like GNAT family acetyltransferase